MRLRKKIKFITTFLAACLLIGPAVNIQFSSGKVSAAIFTPAEKNLVNQRQTLYESLDKTVYSPANLYAVPPKLVDLFSPGQLPNQYINAQVAYLNYYRTLFDLGPISSNPEDNKAAQVTAAVMAATNADPFVDQHGLNTITKPDFINQSEWLTARQVSSSSNLNFNPYQESAGDVMTDFLKDNNNLSGADTGHRAWLLSTRLSRTGIGAAYGTNGYRYSVQTVMYGDDIYRAASKSTVSYPSSGIFPIELLEGGDVPWSFYISDQKINTTPVITIRDMDTNTTSTATNVGNYSKNNYGNFNTVITYSPGNISLISGHQYEVSIQGIGKYTFKLYNQVRANQPPYQTEETTPPVEDKKPTEVIKDQLTIEAEKIRDSLLKRNIISPEIFGRSYQDGKKFINLGSKQWFHDFYFYSNSELEAGVIDIRDRSINREIFTSPYANLQYSTHSYLEAGKSYPYGQKIINGKYTWYYLGPNTWVKQITIKPTQKN